MSIPESLRAESITVMTSSILCYCKIRFKPKQINGSSEVHFIARGKAHFALCQLSIELAHTDLIQKNFYIQFTVQLTEAISNILELGT